MARFTTRVELTDAEWEDYEELHVEMGNRGFTKTITDGRGTTYQLPDAEYNYEGEETTAEVLNMAKQAATETGKRFKILVTKATERRWLNLERDE